ncbi:MAG: hypothetical protein M3N51_00615 [Actinomycetota bacterium]|nr:hypothetical protein [Actinomycetota bacterium]
MLGADGFAAVTTSRQHPILIDDVQEWEPGDSLYQVLQSLEAMGGIGSPLMKEPGPLGSKHPRSMYRQTSTH